MSLPAYISEWSGYSKCASFSPRRYSIPEKCARSYFSNCWISKDLICIPYQLTNETSFCVLQKHDQFQNLLRKFLDWFIPLRIHIQQRLSFVFIDTPFRVWLSDLGMFLVMKFRWPLFVVSIFWRPFIFIIGSLLKTIINILLRNHYDSFWK